MTVYSGIICSDRPNDQLEKCLMHSKKNNILICKIEAIYMVFIEDAISGCFTFDRFRRNLKIVFFASLYCRETQFDFADHNFKK